MRYVVILAALAAASCTTYKLWAYYGSEPENGTVQLSYEYHKFENPQVDERAGTNMARERCRDFGLPDAVRKGEDRVCVDGDKANCPKWRVIREYRCVKSGQR